MQLDYASILGAGQSLVPNLREEVARRQEQTLRGQEAQMRQQAMQMKLAEAEQQATERQRFNARLSEFQRNPTPQGASAMMLEFPEFADQFKAGWSVLDEDQKRTNLSQMGEIYWRANKGDYQGAADKLKTRIEADREAGQDVADDEQLYEALVSGDPQAQKEAAGLIAFHTRAGDPEGFDKLFPQDKTAPTELEKKYREIEARRGKAYADQWYDEQTQEVVIGQPGAPIYRKSDIIGGNGFQQGGGDPASSGGASETSTGPVSFSMPVQGGTFTSGIGDARSGGRKHNGQDIAAPAGTPVSPVAAGTVVAVGRDKLSGNFVKIKHADGSTSSYSHLGDVAVQRGQQIAPGASLGTVGATGNATGNVLHLRIVGKDGKNMDPRPLLGGVVTVRSVQDAQKLPKGTRYRNPEGREFVR